MLVKTEIYILYLYIIHLLHNNKECDQPFSFQVVSLCQISLRLQKYEEFIHKFVAENANYDNKSVNKYVYIYPKMKQTNKRIN